MGFLSVLGKIGKVAGVGAAGLATALTGGAASPALMATLGGISAGGSTLGALADARAQGKAVQGQANQSQDAIGLQAHTAQQNALLAAAQQHEQAMKDAGTLDLEQKNYALSAPGQKLSNAIRGGAASRIQDVTANRPDGIPNISFKGGLRPSLIGPAGREAGGEMERQALMSMMNPETMSALPTSGATVMDEFKQTPLPKAGLLDKILGAAGTVGGIGTGVMNAQDAISKILGQARAKPFAGAPPQLAGVTPFFKPPTATFPQPQGDWSNR